MKDDKVLKIYKKYFVENYVRCHGDEAEKVIKEYEKTGKVDDEYKIESLDEGYIVWREEDISKSLDEMKAEMSVEQANNIKIIKKCVVFFTVFFIISLVIDVILAFVLNRG